MSLRNYFLLLCGWSATALSGQTPQLDALLTEGLRDVPRLQRRNAEIRAAQAQLAEAEAAGGLRVDLGGTYTLAAGGRSIDLPVGDLLNPVYGTLNQLTQTNGFPQIDNVEEQFLPNNFYDLRLRATYPIYRPEIKLNQQIRAEQVSLAKTQQRITRRDLERDLRVAYWQLQSATAAVTIYEEALDLVAEALRTTRSQIANGVALPAARLRLEAERAELLAQRAQAVANRQQAAAQLNYLLARPLEVAVDLDSVGSALPELLEPTTTGRGELDQLRSALTINALAESVEQQFYRPKIGVQLDAGSQAFNFELAPYALLGLSVDLPIWDNRMHRRRLDRLAAERDAQSARLDDTARQLALEALTIRQQLAADLERVARYGPAVTAARRAYTDTQRLYREGLTGYLNIVDARTQLTRLRLQRTLAIYTAWIRHAELLRATEN